MEKLEGFGVDYAEFPAKNTLEWFVRIRPLSECWAAQPTFLLAELTFYFTAAATLIHSFLVGGRWKYLWLGTVFHGLTTELVAVSLPDIDSYWQSQTSIIFLGGRLPLHIILIYPTFMYCAAYTVAHLRLPRWAEPCAAGLTEVLMDIPYDIMSVKFIHWTWHDTDPNIYDRHYHVPWSSYYFHLTFGTAFTFFIHFWRRKITGHDDKMKVSTPGKEILCAFLAGLCGMPGGVLQFIALYHPLHDTYKVHTENCVMIIVLTYILIVWSADRTPPAGNSRRQSGDGSHWSVLVLVVAMVVHYSLYLCMAIFGSPENEVSIGLHEAIGDCNQTSDVFTAVGTVLKKKSFLCPSDYDEPYYSLKCGSISTPPVDGSNWYTICGTPFPNRAEYVSMLTAICFFAAIIYYNMLFRSGPIIVQHKQTKQQASKQKKKN